jgi:hypothetical protein
LSLLQTFSRLTRTFSELSEQRRSYRHSVECAASIDIGGGAPLCGCTVLDISEGGARLKVMASYKLPEEFALILLSAQMPIRRRCRVIWRSDDQLGVSYIEPSGTPAFSERSSIEIQKDQD